MKFFRILFRSFRDSLKSVGRNFSLSIASITCIMITLIIVGVSILVSYNIDNATKFTKIIEKNNFLSFIKTFALL